MDMSYSISNYPDMQELTLLFARRRRALLRLLRKSHLIRRKRIIKNYSVLLHAALLYFVHQYSFRRLALHMALFYHVSMSDTAWEKQLAKFAPVFWQAVQKILSHTPAVSSSAPLLALDATHFSMQGSSVPPLRLHSCVSTDSRTVEQLFLSDLHTPESVRHFSLRHGCCYLADRAYATSSQMAYMLEQNADFIFRLSPSQVKLFTSPQCAQRLDFQALLAQESFSVHCYFRYQRKVYGIRLVGTLLPQEKQDTAIQRTRKKSRKKQNRTRPSTLEYARWLLLATTLSDAEPNICETYRKRWQIELFFKTGKTLLNLHKLKRSSVQWANHQIELWMTIVTYISALYLEAQSASLPLPSPFFAFALFLTLIS